MNDSDSDALVFFGATGDLAYKKPAHYLAIPPVLFGLVVEQLGKSGCAKGARVIVEKPFGTDLASARELNRILFGTFPEKAIFRIDHFLGKRPVHNMLYFRFANSFLEPFWWRYWVVATRLQMRWTLTKGYWRRPGGRCHLVRPRGLCRRGVAHRRSGAQSQHPGLRI